MIIPHDTILTVVNAAPARPLAEGPRVPRGTRGDTVQDVQWTLDSLAHQYSGELAANKHWLTATLQS